VFGVRVATVRGEVLLATNTQMMRQRMRKYAPGEVQVVRWPVSPGLAPDDYFISCGCSRGEDAHQFYLREIDAYRLSVTGRRVSAGLCAIANPAVLEAPAEVQEAVE
jgi:hypothetical protein